MLAAVDDESYQEQSPVIQKPTTNPKSFTNHAVRHSSQISTGSDTESESSTDEPIRARGTLAARLQYTRPAVGVSRISPAATDQDDNDGQETGDAYDRIKGKPLAKATPAEDDGPIVQRRQQAAFTDEFDGPQSPAASPNRSHRSSPSLFLTPGTESRTQSPSKPTVKDDSDSDLPVDPQKNERFLALVARKQAEREAKEAEEAQKGAAREAQQKQWAKKGSARRSATPLGDSEDDSDDVVAKKLTQQARPTRKASKKALEEMSRETQRMNRNMQLAHQARTKKKITKESLFARFNFHMSKGACENAQQAQTSSPSVSSAILSETEGVQHHGTPPTSPTAPPDSPKLRAALNSATQQSMDFTDHEPSDNDELPSIDDVMVEARPTMKKGKGKANELLLGETPPMPERFKRIPKKAPVKLRFRKGSAVSRDEQGESDSELEILPARKDRVCRLDIFDRLSAGKPTEARSLQTLRALAHLNSPEKGPGKSRASMTPSEMQVSLQQRARQQAAAERAEKIQELKDRGIIVQTAEERQKDQAEVEDLVEMARQEAVNVKKKEKDAAKRAAKRAGEDYNDSSDDDEEYQANEADESEIDLSGSEEEDAVSEGSEDEPKDEDDAEEDKEEGGVVLEDESMQSNRLVEDEALDDAEDEDSSESSYNVDSEIASDREEISNLLHKKSRVTRIVEEDDDDSTNPQPTQNLSPALETPQKPMIPAIALGTSPGLMGMTQAFAATLADSQTQANGNVEMDAEQDSMSFLGAVPEPNVPIIDANDSESIVLDSQADSVTGENTNASGINLDLSQSQIDYAPSLEIQDLPMATQDFEIPEPTQDMGFHMSSPAGNRFVPAPPSTIDTVLLPEDSLIKKKKGRLQRGRKGSIDPSDAEEDTPRSPQELADSKVSANVFDIMKKKRKAAVAAPAFDKRKSNAKEMVEDQAQESEDEYAGLGGASDDESVGEEDEDLKKMIEEGDVAVDERKLAAYYAYIFLMRSGGSIAYLFTATKNAHPMSKPYLSFLRTSTMAASVANTAQTSSSRTLTMMPKLDSVPSSGSSQR